MCSVEIMSFGLIDDTLQKMADSLTPAHRSWNMSRIHGCDTSPEKMVQNIQHRMGLRFSLHRVGGRRG